MNAIIYRVLGALSIFFFGLFVSISIGCEKPQNFELPIPPDAYEIKKGFNEALCALFVNYKVDRNFPADEIIRLYQNFFSDFGYVDFDYDGYGSRQWENFNSSTGEWQKTDSTPARFIATWIDKDRKFRAVLVLIYKPDQIGGKPKDLMQDLYVDCKIVPYFELD